MSARLYRVVREHCYNGGNHTQVCGTKVLYCGYDRLEAARVYHKNNVPSRNTTPGNYYHRVRAQSGNISSVEV